MRRARKIFTFVEICALSCPGYGWRMIREIVTYGDPVLREKCPPVGEITETIRTLAADMVDTMRAADGVGLAAPQIGVALQLAVVDISHAPESISYLKVDGQDTALDAIMPLIFVNPKLEFGGTRESESEGCLSIPEIRGNVDRPVEVQATLTLLDGRTITVETDGLLARALQHEADHLHGVLFTDRISSAAKVRMRIVLKRLLAEQGPRRYLPRPGME
ncbi:MAG: peptide deformylase [Verrucomicrobiales bacterium]